MISTNNFLYNFFKNLQNENIRYSVLRNYEGLPNSLNGSDLDILVSKNDVSKFYDLLNQTLELNNGKIIVQYGKLTPRVCIAGVIENNYYGVQFDVHEGILPYKVFDMFPVEFVLDRSKLHNGILVANDDDADILSFLKEILNNQTCKEKYFLAAKKSWQKDNIYKIELKKMYTKEFIKQFDLVMNNTYDEVKIKELSILGSKYLTNGINKKVKILKSKLERMYRFFKTPGFIVAVMGTDGAGKTTIIDKITEPLKEAVHNALFYEHMRPNLIPNIAQLFGKKKQEGPVVDPHSSKPSGIFGSLVRLFYYSFDYIFGYLLKIYPMTVKKSSIWIFDRYYYDYMIDPKRARINLPQWTINTMGYFIPKPDLVLCFGADPKVIFDRKPELLLEEITEQVNKLKEFCDKNDKAIWIDTGKSIDDSVKEAFTTILEKMNERY